MSARCQKAGMIGLSLCLLAAFQGCAVIGTTTQYADKTQASTPPAAANPYLADVPKIEARARERFEAGTVALSVGDWQTAAADMQWLVANYPRLSGPYLNLALIAAQQDDSVEAERWFRAALEVNPDNLDAYNQFAVWLREQGRFDEAEAAYLAALEVWPAHPETHRNLGVLYDLYRGNAELALRHYYRYQALTDEQNRRVAGWIVDLERRSGQLVSRGTP